MIPFLIAYSFVHVLNPVVNAIRGKLPWKQGGMYMKAQMIIIAVVIVLCTAGLWELGEKNMDNCLHYM